MWPLLFLACSSLNQNLPYGTEQPGLTSSAERVSVPRLALPEMTKSSSVFSPLSCPPLKLLYFLFLNITFSTVFRRLIQKYFLNGNDFIL